VKKSLGLALFSDKVSTFKENQVLNRTFFCNFQGKNTTYPQVEKQA